MSLGVMSQGLFFNPTAYPSKPLKRWNAPSHLAEGSSPGATQGSPKQMVGQFLSADVHKSIAVASPSSTCIALNIESQSYQVRPRIIGNVLGNAGFRQRLKADCPGAVLPTKRQDHWSNITGETHCCYSI